MNKNVILIDLEFTGLDNSYIKDNEIIQLKMRNTANGITFIKNYGSDKALSAHCQLDHGVERYDAEKFSAKSFYEALILLEWSSDQMYAGFGVQKDIEMLRKYGVNLTDIIDIRTKFQLSEHEYRMATEGSGLEEVYFIATGENPNLESHNGLNELLVIEKLWNIISSEMTQKVYLTVMPHGHCAGMPLEEYVTEYRRAADGYRWNNNDLLADSLDFTISTMMEEDDLCPFEDDDESLNTEVANKFIKEEE